jgi:hypothetical protein
MELQKKLCLAFRGAYADLGHSTMRVLELEKTEQYEKFFNHALKQLNDGMSFQTLIKSYTQSRTREFFICVERHFNGNVE